MTKPKHGRKSPAKSADKLAKSSGKGAVELSETALDKTSGGAVFPSAPALNTLKIETPVVDKMSPGLLLPAVYK